MSNDGARLMISTWIILNVSWAASTNFLRKSYWTWFISWQFWMYLLHHPAKIYDHFWFLSRLAPTQYLDILGQYAFFKHAMMVKFVVEWITFHRSAGRKWLVAFLPLALSAHQVLAASFLSFACGTVLRTLETFAIFIRSKKIQSFLHHLGFLN